MDDAWLQEIHNLRMGGDTFAKGLNITTPYQSSLGALLCFALFSVFSSKVLSKYNSYS